MADYLDHSSRWQHHRQPRVPDSHWSRDGDLHGGTDPGKCDECAPSDEKLWESLPIGTPVRYWPGVREGDGIESVARSEVWILGGHTPVVMVEGYAGGIALTHIDRPHPLTPATPAWDAPLPVWRVWIAQQVGDLFAPLARRWGA